MTRNQINMRVVHQNRRPFPLFEGPGAGGLKVQLGDKHVVILYHGLLSAENGFSFNVSTELEAFQAAYFYRNMKTEIEFGQSVWRVVIRQI